MTMTKVGAAAPSGSQTTTTFQFGTYNAVTDTFTQSLDLNDQVTYFLKPGKGGSPNPKFDQKSTAVRADNVRSDGSNVVKDHLDNIIGTAVFTIKATTPQGVSDAWNAVVKLIKGQQGAKGGALCLRFAWPQSAAYSYLDIQYASVTTPPGSPLEIQAKASTGLVIALEGGYAWRGDRLTFQNLVPNPGFEYPVGGALAPAVLGFSDAFTTVNAYAVQAGGTPTTAPSNTYTDIVFANIPGSGGSLLRYYRLGLADSGTTSLDISGNAQAGTTHASPTMAVAGLISGDTDTCYTFAGASSQYVSIPSTGLPIGNAAMSLAAWVKDAAAPGGLAVLWGYGDTTTNHHTLQVLLDTSNKVAVNVGGSTICTTAAGLTTGVAHLVVVTWDGTTLSLYVDNAAAITGTPGAQAIPSNPTVNLGATSAPNSFFTGQVDEACIYSGTLSAGQVTTLYNAGHTGATGTLANAMSVPAASRVAFGSPAWGAVQTWQTRFRYATSQVSAFYLHYTNANNNLQVKVQAGSNNFAIIHTIAGVANTILTGTAVLQHEAWYWLQVTQFPIAEVGFAPTVQAILSYDNAGAVGANVATLVSAVFDSVTAMVGAPQINPTGAALVVGGKSNGLGHAWYTFGPGGWVTTLNGGTGAAALAWDGSTTGYGMSGNGGANTYPGGPWASNGTARIDGAAAGTLSAKVQIYRGSATDGAPLTTLAIPVAAATDVLEIAGACKTNSVSGTATLSLSVTEYDGTGASLRTDTGWSAPSKTAAQAASWVALSGTYTTGASCAYIDLACVVVDSTANSAGKAFWFDNLQCQDRTFTGTQNMPYCELRFPNSPAQPQISGIQGTLTAPSVGMLGSIPTATIASPATYQFLAGRRLVPTSGAVLITPVGATVVPITLDATSYGGFYASSGSGASQTVRWYSPLLSTTAAAIFGGVYFLVSRYQTRNATTAGLTLQATATLANSATVTDTTIITGGVMTAPMTSLNTWGQAQLGKFDLSMSSLLMTTDLTKIIGADVEVNGTMTNTTGDRLNSLALIPVDGGVVTGRLYGASDGNVAQGFWFWCYMDGLDAQMPRWAWNTGAGGASISAQAQALNTAIGTGTTTSNLTLGADPSFTLDPNATIAGTSVNQFVVQIDDTSGQQTVMPILTEFTYSPLWHAPR